ncbi:MAG: hypothetical protein AAFQ82_13705 [Myxococcota bacterium]
MRTRCAWCLFAMLVGCGASNESPDPSVTESTFSIPRLSAGTHVSMIRGFNLPDPDLDPVLDQYWRTALDAGMSAGRIQIDWADLETAPGVYEEQRLVNELERSDLRGLELLAGVYALDTEGPVLPDDLQERVLDGERLDSAVVGARWESFLRWMMPVLDRHRVWGLLVANEPDSWIVDEGNRPAEEIAAFYAAANRVADELAPEIVVGATHTSFVRTNPERFHNATLRELDFASYNYYPLDAQLRSAGSDRASIRSSLDRFRELSDGKPFMIQELGASAGWSDRPSPMGASVAQQTEFYRASLEYALREPQLRAVFAFQLVDWSEELYGIFTEIFEAEGLPEDFIARHDEYLGTLGLVDLDGNSRPAWNEFLSAIETSGEQR